MRVWLRRMFARMAEPRVATGIAVAIYLTCLGLATALLVRFGAVGGDWVMVIPPALLGLASIVGAVSAWRGGYWGWAFEQLALLAAAGGLISGAVVEVWDLVCVNDPASYYTLAFLVGTGVLAVFRSRFLFAQARSWRQFQLRVRALVE